MRGTFNAGTHAIVVVISPLLSLMKNQANCLNSRSIKAALLVEGQEDELVKDGVEKHCIIKTKL